MWELLFITALWNVIGLFWKGWRKYNVLEPSTWFQDPQKREVYVFDYVAPGHKPSGQRELRHILRSIEENGGEFEMTALDNETGAVVERHHYVEVK